MSFNYKWIIYIRSKTFNEENNWNKEVVEMGDLQQENQYGKSQWNVSPYSHCNF